MKARFTEAVRQWGVWFLIALIILAVVIWFISRQPVPREIRIATAMPGGLYHKFGVLLEPLLEEETKSQVTLVETRGTIENIQLLIEGKVDMAIMQSGVAPMEGLYALAPLWPDVVHVVVRRDSGITCAADLQGRSVALGPEGSGMRASALEIIEHYQIDPETLKGNECYFKQMATDETLEAAIVTTGLLNPDLTELMSLGDFCLVPVLDAEAISIRHPNFAPFNIPRGIYGENPAKPDQPIGTIATTSFLGAREDISPKLVKAGLDVIYHRYPPTEFPTVIPQYEALARPSIPVHPAARNYHDPFGGLQLLTNAVESLAGIKELLFALGAGLYLVWLRVRRLRERKEEQSLEHQRERLDSLLDETVAIERAQMEVTDVPVLKLYLNEVTKIKLKALDELTHQDLRGDRLFSIFLMQCANLIRKIQDKIRLYSE